MQSGLSDDHDLCFVLDVAPQSDALTHSTHKPTVATGQEAIQGVQVPARRTFIFLE